MIKKDHPLYKKKDKIKEYLILENSTTIKNNNLQKNNPKRDCLKLVHLKRIQEWIYLMITKAILKNKIKVLT